MSNPPPEGENAPSEKRQSFRWSGVGWGCLFVFLLWLVIDLFAITLLGTKANNTFTVVPTNK